MRFEYADESDRVRYPIPRGVHIEGGGDRHALLVDKSACRLYELFALNSGWNNDALHELGRIRGTDFEVVRTG